MIMMMMPTRVVDGDGDDDDGGVDGVVDDEGVREEGRKDILQYKSNSPNLNGGKIPTIICTTHPENFPNHMILLP